MPEHSPAAPMSVRTLSFTTVQPLYRGSSGETRWKSAPFQGEAKFEPLSGSLQVGLRFFQHPLPAEYCTAFTVGLLTFQVRTHRAYRVPRA